MTKILIIVSVALALAGTSPAVGAENRAAQRALSAAAAVDAILGAPSKSFPAELLSAARCVAVAPSLPKVLGFAGARVRGLASCRVDGGWSAPAPFGITGGGVEGLIRFKGDTLVLLIMNEKGRSALSSGKMRLGIDASIAPGPFEHAGKTADAFAYLRARGLLLGIPLSDVVLSQDQDSTRELYGRMVPSRRILQGAVAAPLGAEPFVSALRRSAPTK